MLVWWPGSSRHCRPTTTTLSHRAVAPQRHRVASLETATSSASCPLTSTVYLRNTENPCTLRSAAITRSTVTDAPRHRVRQRDGGVRNRFIRTAGFEAELRPASRCGPAWPTAEPVAATDGAPHGMKDASSTDVVVYGGRGADELLPVWRLRPRSSDARAVRRRAWDGGSRKAFAHPKVDPGTGELLFFNYSTQRRTSTSASSTAANDRALHADRPTRAASARHGVHRGLRHPQRLPAVLGPALLRRGVTPCASILTCRPASGFCPAAPTDIRWFEASPTYVCTGSTPSRTAMRSSSTASSSATPKRRSATRSASAILTVTTGAADGGCSACVSTPPLSIRSRTAGASTSVWAGQRGDPVRRGKREFGTINGGRLGRPTATATRSCRSPGSCSAACAAPTSTPGRPTSTSSTPGVFLSEAPMAARPPVPRTTATSSRSPRTSTRPLRVPGVRRHRSRRRTARPVNCPERICSARTAGCPPHLVPGFALSRGQPARHSDDPRLVAQADVDGTPATWWTLVLRWTPVFVPSAP